MATGFWSIWFPVSGVDDVFVFINTFRQAEQFQEPSDRMLHTILNAGKATFFTSFTTAAAFAANVASSVRFLCSVVFIL